MQSDKARFDLQEKANALSQNLPLELIEVDKVWPAKEAEKAWE